MRNKSETPLLFSRFLFTVLVLLLLGIRSSAKDDHNQRKLFVFGDSYGDTGNWKRGTGISWELPYGSTFPGKPTGRFSDGRILTDFIASYMGIRSPPVPYEQRRSSSSAKKLKYGMNFAYGGTGVFNTDVLLPNMTTQIDFFQNVLESDNTYTRHDLETSIGLVTLAGNDYAKFLRASSQQEIQRFTSNVVDQLVSNLKRIRGLGVPKIAVTGLEPLGCLPAVTTSISYRNCSDRINAVAALHNRFLEQRVTELNNQTRGSSPAFFVLDLYNAFMSGFKTPLHQKEKMMENESGLKPCCEGVRGGHYGCGSKKGNETKYNLCSEPNAAFFWDSVHPAQHGWYLVFLSLKSSLHLVK